MLRSPGEYVVGADKRYRAFISYSQQDLGWGRRLQGWLETYRVPMRGLVEVDLPPRLGRFFRDDADMAAAADIAEIVRHALEDAESLIVICSPRSAKSKWVNAEIHHFRRTGRGRKVFAFIIDGDPNSGDPETECFPPALRAVGDPDDPDALPIEPLGLDVRKDGKPRACARLAAGLLGIDFDDLWQRDRRRAERRHRWLLGGFAAASLVFASLAATAVTFALQARHRAAILSIEGARTVLAEGDADGALLVLLEAARTFSGATAPDRLLIGFDEALQRATAETIYPLPAGAYLFDAPNGVFITDPTTGSVSLLDGDGPPRIVVPGSDSPQVFVGRATDGALITVREDSKIERWIDGRSEILGSFAPQYLYGPSTSFSGVPLDEIALSPDEVLLLQPDCGDCEGDRDEYLVQAFDTVARKFYRVTLARNNALNGRAYYVRMPDGRRIIFSPGDMVLLDGRRPKPAPSRTELMEYLCTKGAPIPRDVAAALRKTGERLLEPSHCASSDGAVLLSVAALNGLTRSYDGRRDYLFKPDDPIGKSSIQSWLHSRYLANPVYSYVAGGMRGNYFGQISTVRYDQPSRTLAVAFGRDLLIGGNEKVLDWRMPDLVPYVQLLANSKVAALDLDGQFIRVLDYGTPHPYAARRIPDAEAKRYYRADEDPWPQRCPTVKATVDGAPLTVEYLGSGADMDDQAVRVKLVGTKGEVEKRFAVIGNCVRVSSTGRYAAVVDDQEVAHIIDLRRMREGAANAEIGALERAIDVAFPGPGPEVVFAEADWDPDAPASGVLIRRMAPGGGPRSTRGSSPWRVVQELYRGRANQLGARLNSTGRRVILFEQLGTDDDRGAQLYSLEAQRTFRRLGAYVRWFDAGFTESGEAYALVGTEDAGTDRWKPILMAIAPHDMASARTAARIALSGRCRSFPGDAYRRSPCWPKAFAD